MKDDLKEAIIDLESDMKIGQDDVPLPAEKSEEESFLRRQGSIKLPKESKCESLKAEITDKAVAEEEGHGGAIGNITKSKFQMDDIFTDDNSKISTSHGITSTMSNILITYQVDQNKIFTFLI